MSTPRQRRGQGPTGFRWSGGNLVPVPEETEIVKLAFDLFLTQRRKADVARILNQRGFRSRQGKLWSGMTVTRLLTGSGAVGEYVVQKTGDIVPCNPIVNRETWDKVRALLAEQKEPDRRPSAKVVHALSGLVVCGACDRKMYPRAGKFLCDSCRNKIPMDDLEGIFIDELEEFWRARSPSGQSPSLKKAWPPMQARERRNLADALVEMFVVGDNSIEIRYKFPDFLKEPVKHAQIKLAPEALETFRAPGDPEYIRLPKPGERCAVTGMSRSALNELILPTKRNGFRPPVRSVSLRTGAQTRGTRMIVLADLKRYLAEKETEADR